MWRIPLSISPADREATTSSLQKNFGDASTFASYCVIFDGAPRIAGRNGRVSQLPSSSVAVTGRSIGERRQGPLSNVVMGFFEGKRRVFVTPGGVVVALGRRIHSRMPRVRIGVNLFAKILLPNMAMKFVKAFCAAESLTSPVDFTSVGVKEHHLGRLVVQRRDMAIRRGGSSTA